MDIFQITAPTPKGGPLVPSFTSPFDNLLSVLDARHASDECLLLRSANAISMIPRPKEESGTIPLKSRMFCLYANQNLCVHVLTLI